MTHAETLLFDTFKSRLGAEYGLSGAVGFSGGVLAVATACRLDIPDIESAASATYIFGSEPGGAQTCYPWLAPPGTSNSHGESYMYYREFLEEHKLAITTQSPSMTTPDALGGYIFRTNDSKYPYFCYVINEYGENLDPTVPDLMKGITRVVPSLLLAMNTYQQVGAFYRMRKGVCETVIRD